MDSIAGLPQTKDSSTCTSGQVSDLQSRGCSQNNGEFFNHGLALWNGTRQQWLINRKPQKYTLTQLREPAIRWNATYNSLLGTSKPFDKPIPLGEMIDFLLDIWDEEDV